MSRTAKSLSRESAVRVFVSYSHKDSYWMDALMPLLRFPGVRVKPWNDQERPLQNSADDAGKQPRMTRMPRMTAFLSEDHPCHP